MANIFKVALSKIGAGVKFVGVAVWHKLKDVFTSDQAKAIGKGILMTTESLLKSELGAFIKQTVLDLENAPGTGPDKLASATSAVVGHLESQGKSLPTTFIQAMIQNVLVVLRGQVAGLTDNQQDSDGDGIPDTLDAHPFDPSQK